jgi:5-methylcytosine-specific restriction endonuclease McrA
MVVDRCVVLNGDYSYLNAVSWKKAICMLMKEKAEVLKWSDVELRNSEGQVITKVPLVMRLVRVVKMIYRNKVPYSKRNVFVRDGFKCAYCGKSSFKLTVDHVLPQSKGGKTTFENCVAACRPCNHKKGNRTPKEANMPLRRRPYTPTIYEFIRLKMKHYKIDEFLKDIGVY